MVTGLPAATYCYADRCTRIDKLLRTLSAMKRVFFTAFQWTRCKTKLKSYEIWVLYDKKKLGFNKVITLKERGW